MHIILIIIALILLLPTFIKDSKELFQDLKEDLKDMLKGSKEKPE